MGSDSSKLSYRNVIVQLTTKTQPVDADDDQFWDQFWSNGPISAQDIFALVPAAEVRALREESPNNLATLCYKTVERLSQIAEASFPTAKDQQIALNCVRLLTRILPYVFEDPEWRSFFWSTLPSDPDSAVDGECIPLAQSLIAAVCDLLFCPDFTVQSISKTGPQGPEDMHAIDSCEYIWQAGVGFAQNTVHNTTHDSNRTELLKLLLTCFSETMYLERDETQYHRNKWVSFFTSPANRHALPLFTSLINVVCAYDPVGFGLPYNHLMFRDCREPLVEVALQILCIVLEGADLVSSSQHVISPASQSVSSSMGLRRESSDTQWSAHGRSRELSTNHDQGSNVPDSSDTGMVNRSNQTTKGFLPNSLSGTVVTSPVAGAVADTNLFVNYMSRIHRDEDFSFILSGLTRLLNSPLTQTYLPGSMKKVHMHQELLVLFWRMCGANKKFMYYVLKSSQVLEFLVPVLYHLNDARSDQARLGLVHVAVFIVLLLSGERNFGVRLNKPYKGRLTMDISMFTGTHADLLIIVFHKLITCGHKRLQPLFDCLLTIIANVSPYLKSLSMVTTNKLLHLLEAFSQPWYLYSGPSNYQLVFLLLEVFNNIVQYQFDGNSNLVYTLIRKRQVFYHLANLPTDLASIQRIINRPNPDKASKSSEEKHSVCSKINASGHQQTEQRAVVASACERTSNGGNMDSSLRPSTNSTDQKTKVSTNETENSANHLKTTLANTPAVGSMTDEHLENVSFPSSTFSTDANISTELNNPHRHSDLNTLISHSSPTRGVRQKDDPLQAVDVNDLTDQLPSKVSLTVDGNETLESVDQSSCIIDRHSITGTNTVHDKKQGRNHSDSDNSSFHGSTVPTALGTTTAAGNWSPTAFWVSAWKAKMPLQTIMRLLQVLVPQVEKICIDKGLTDESEIVKFLQNGTLVGLLPVPHPILIRKYQSNAGTTLWFRNYLWGVIYLRNVSPPIWYDTNVRLFEIHRV